jgi:hypothetical protein
MTVNFKLSNCAELRHSLRSGVSGTGAEASVIMYTWYVRACDFAFCAPEVGASFPITITEATKASATANWRSAASSSKASDSYNRQRNCQEVFSR